MRHTSHRTMKNNHFIGITGFLAIIVIIITGMVSPQTVKAEEDTTIPSGTVYLPLLVRSSNYTAPQPEKPWLTYLNQLSSDGRPAACHRS